MHSTGAVKGFMDKKIFIVAKKKIRELQHRKRDFLGILYVIVHKDLRL